MDLIQALKILAIPDGENARQLVAAIGFKFLRFAAIKKGRLDRIINIFLSGNNERVATF